MQYNLYILLIVKFKNIKVLIFSWALIYSWIALHILQVDKTSLPNFMNFLCSTFCLHCYVAHIITQLTQTLRFTSEISARIKQEMFCTFYHSKQSDTLFRSESRSQEIISISINLLFNSQLNNCGNNSLKYFEQPILYYQCYIIGQ